MIDGKIINADMSIDPMILIPITIVIAVKIAINILNASTFIPVALANSSSNVSAKILL